jgi:hypothetical protein
MNDPRIIPPDLLQRYPELVKGLTAYNQARDAARFNGILRDGPQRITQVLPEIKPAPILSTYIPKPIQPKLQHDFERVKIWPELGLAAILHRHAGAWRAWSFARDLDHVGVGHIGRRELWQYLTQLGVGERQRRRWVGDAVRIGLFRVYREQYDLLSLEKAGLILGCDHIGKPARITSSGLCGAGWRAYVWAGYLATLGNRPVSQAIKAELTGIDPRTQRNYQADVPGEARKNYSKTEIKPGDMEGDREVNQRVLFENGGQVFQRLPDIRIVPAFVAECCQRGRSKKAQKLLNSSSLEGRGSEYTPRLFCSSSKQLKATIRKISRSDRTPPNEVFRLVWPGKNANLYQSITL